MPRLARNERQGLMSPLEIQLDTMANDPLRPNLSSKMMQQDLINKGLLAIGMAPLGMVTGKGLISAAASKARSQAQVGGQVAESNGYFYKGGQFLPSTSAEPGRWKVGKKWVNSGKEMIEPNVYANQPTPFSRSILSMIGQQTEKLPDGSLSFRKGVMIGDGSPFSPDMMFRPGVKGVLGKEEVSFQEMLDAYNQGQRWFDVMPDALTQTTK